MEMNVFPPVAGLFDLPMNETELIAFRDDENNTDCRDDNWLQYGTLVFVDQSAFSTVVPVDAGRWLATENAS